MVKENIKLPDVGLTPVGHVTIDLMDEDGNIIERQKKDNFVHTKLLEAIGRAGMRRGINPAGPFLNYYTIPRLANSLILTNESSPASPLNDRKIQGDIAGAGAYNHITSSDIVGNYNRLESVWEPNYIKLVYDFSTSTANGTFQSIYVSPGSFEEVGDGVDIEEGLVPIFTIKDESGNSPTAEWGLARWFSSKTEIYHVYESTFKRTKQLNLSKFDSMESLYNSQDWEEYTLDFVPHSVTLNTRNSRYYFNVLGSNNTSLIYSSPTDDPSNTRLEHEVPDILGTGTYTYGLFYEEERDTYLLVTYNGVLRLDSSFKILEVTNIDTSRTGSISYPYYAPRSKVLSVGNSGTRNRYSVYDLENDRYLRSGYNLTTGVNSYLEINDDLVLLSRYYNSSGNVTQLHARYGFFSRAVLDSPVTKTAQNTMKITYEYTMDDWIAELN